MNYKSFRPVKGYIIAFIVVMSLALATTAHGQPNDQLAHAQNTATVVAH